MDLAKYYRHVHNIENEDEVLKINPHFGGSIVKNKHDFDMMIQNSY